MRKTNAGRPSFVETDKTTTLKKNTKNDDYDILYSSNTLCLNCAFVAANCVVADETANMVFGICDDDDDDARWRSKKNGGIFEKKKTKILFRVKLGFRVKLKFLWDRAAFFYLFVRVGFSRVPKPKKKKGDRRQTCV